MLRKLEICLLSLFLCLGALTLNISDTKAYDGVYDCQFYDGEIFRLAVGTSLQLETDVYDYYKGTTVKYHFQLNNDHISIDKNGKVVGKSVGDTIVTASYTMNNRTYTYKITFHVTNPMLTKSNYTIYNTGYYDDFLCKVYIKGLEKESIVNINSGDFWIYDSNYSKGYIEFYVYGNSTAIINVDGKELKVSFKIVTVELSASNTISQQLGSLVTYKGKSDTLTLKLNGVKKKPVSWKSTKTSVAKVDANGKVTGNNIGRAYIRAYMTENDYVEYLVECTYKNAYQAVVNGFNDLLKGDGGKTIKYSQDKRMSKGYRDCSSFVSRCYYDTTLGRKIYKIGDIKGNYASTAADQAKWLYNKGKTVANGWVKEEQLLPGDTIYTCGSSDNKRWRKIYHATLYVGNGCVITTGSASYSGATLSLRYYDYNGSNIQFIGRPMKPSNTVKTTSITLSKTSLTLGVKEKFSLKATKKPTNSTEKITWSSSKSSIASVSSSGVITAKKSGTVYITAKSGSKTKKCKVVVKKAPASIKLNAKTKTLKVKQTYQLKTTLSKGSASYQKTYTSSNSKVASVSSSGKITAKKKGKATITVKTFNGKKASIVITVK